MPENSKNLETPSINECYYVKQDDKNWQKATIIEIRCKNKVNMEYFVHYNDEDRRLDEWVPISRINLASKFYSGAQSCSLGNPILIGPNDSKSGILTRHKKRKFDQLHRSGSASRHFTRFDSETNENSRTSRQIRINRNEESITKNSCCISKPYNNANHNNASTAAATDQEKLEREHELNTRIKYIESVCLGHYIIRTWYYSPYPEAFRQCSMLYICPVCLRYMKFRKTYEEHLRGHNCPQFSSNKPPGCEIYRKDELSVFEINGNVDKLFCQNLCLLAKLFLDHKTLYYDVSPFMFYVLCEIDQYEGCKIVGYFSKEKVSVENNNLACLLTLPPHQRKGYGKFLISFSYELAKIESFIGSPEKPLSDLGKLTYHSYWEFIVFSYLHQKYCQMIAHSSPPPLHQSQQSHSLNLGTSSISEISAATCIAEDDIASVLQGHPLVTYYNRVNKEVEVNICELAEFLNAIPANKKPNQVDLSCLRWRPPSAVVLSTFSLPQTGISAASSSNR